TSTALVPLGCSVPIDLLGRGHRFAPQRRNRVKQSPAVTNHADTEVFQVLGSQLRQYLAIDSVLAERRLILFEAQLPQPACDVHLGASTAMCRNDQTGCPTCPGCMARKCLAALGQTANWGADYGMSASPLRAAEKRTCREVRVGPEADIVHSITSGDRRASPDESFPIRNQPCGCVSRGGCWLLPWAPSLI